MHNMVIRDIQKTLFSISKEFKSITILGPRQSGKTTVSKMCFPDLPYVNFENPDNRRIASADPRAFLKKYSKGGIFDEIQRMPELLSYFQEILDNSKENGKFIFTGSNQLNVHRDITQSLSGRTAIMKLLPFSLNELSEYKPEFSTDEILYRGLFPSIYDQNQNPTVNYSSYFETYIERDLRQMINVKDLRLFRKFMRLCAGRVAQLFNANNLSNEVGVSIPTIQNWISVLQASYIVFFVEPFFANINKRLTKSPKLYFTDVGLASYLLGIENENQVSRDPLRGALFENLVMLEFVKHRWNNGLGENLYFYRDNHQNEVDCMLKKGSTYDVFEIKSSETYHNSFTKGLNYIRKNIPEKINNSFVVYAGDTELISKESHSIINYRKLSGYL